MNFPSSPATGQEYTFEGRTWRYNGKGWQLIGSGTGGVAGPASSTPGHIAVFSGTDGQTVADAGNLLWVGQNSVLIGPDGQAGFVPGSSGAPNDSVRAVSNNNSAGFQVQNKSSIGFSGVEYLGSDGQVKVFTGHNNGDDGEFRFHNIGTNARISFMIHGANSLAIKNNRTVEIATLAGGGHRAVFADSSGTLTAQDSEAARASLDIGTMANRNATISTGDPSGGGNGDVWFKVE